MGATVAHLFVAFVYTPLGRALPASRRSLTPMELSYRDREGVLRRVLAEATAMGYVISDLDVARSDTERNLVGLRFDVEGPRSVEGLVEGLQSLDGVVEVRAGG